MKKIISIVLTSILLVTSFSSVAFAKAIVPPEPIEPNYQETLTIVTTFAIDTKGNLETLIDVRTKSSSTVDRVVTTAKVVNDNTGVVIKTWSNVEMDGPDISRLFSFYKTYQIPQSGKYHLEATIKLYNGTTLMETVTVESVSDSF